MKILIEQEVALHRYEVRTNRTEAVKLLHSEFREVGISGQAFDFDSILELMLNEKPSGLSIHSQDYEVIELEPNVHLVLYKSANYDENYNYDYYAKRSSIWVLNGKTWKLKYHQGTKCEPFELTDNMSK